MISIPVGIGVVWLVFVVSYVLGMYIAHSSRRKQEEPEDDGPKFIHCEDCEAWQQSTFSQERCCCQKPASECVGGCHQPTKGSDGCCEGIPKKGAKVPK